MQTYREKVITGMKEMTRKRYKAIYAKSYDYDRVSYPLKRRNVTHTLKRYSFNVGGERKKKKEKKTGESIDRLMTYEDTVTGKQFTLKIRHGSFVGNSWDTEINKIRDETVNYLYDEIVQKINKFFTSELCLESLECRCPRKITKNEIKFDYPWQCMGDYRCIHPAGKFKESYHYCYTSNQNTRYIKTNKINFDSCMPVQELYIQPLNLLD